MTGSPAQEEQPSLDWAQAPEDATHACHPPGWPMYWLKLGAPAELEQWRWPGGKRWRPGVSWSGEWVNRPHVTARPTAADQRHA